MKTPWNPATRMGVATALAVSTIFVASAATAAPLNPVVGYTIIKLVRSRTSSRAPVAPARPPTSRPAWPAPASRMENSTGRP